MTLYRCDRSETTEHGQTLWFTDWMGGPTLAKVEGAICPDGRRRIAYVTGEPLTYFALPAFVNNGKEKVRGHVWHEDGEGYRFSAFADSAPTDWTGGKCK